jgi:hypothetical protein
LTSERSPHERRDMRVQLPGKPLDVAPLIRATLNLPLTRPTAVDCFVACAPRNDGDAAIALHLTRFRVPHLICPSCQLAAALPACRSHPTHFTFAAIPRPTGGAYRDRHGRKDAGQRWTRGECARRRTGFADGEAVWSRRRDAGVKFLRSKLPGDDGGNKARSPGRARNKP